MRAPRLAEAAGEAAVAAVRAVVPVATNRVPCNSRPAPNRVRSAIPRGRFLPRFGMGQVLHLEHRRGLVRCRGGAVTRSHECNRRLDTPARTGLMSRMRILPVVLVAVAAQSAAAQAGLTLPNAPQFRWEMTGDTTAVFTLTNRDSKPLPRSGWAIYFSALHSADSGSVGAGFEIQDVLGELHRLTPGAGFAGLAPGASIKIPYATDGPLLNKSSVPLGPYIVFDSAPSAPTPITNYVAAPFARTTHIITPQAQFSRDSGVRDIPVHELPPILPTPVQVTPGAGEVRFTAMPQISAPAELANEAAGATDYLRPYFQTARAGSGGGPTFSLAIGP